MKADFTFYKSSQFREVCQFMMVCILTWYLYISESVSLPHPTPQIDFAPLNYIWY